MNNTDVLPAPTMDRRPPNGKWEREEAAFGRLLPELIEQYPNGNQYVAIHDEAVVGHGPDQVALALQVYDQYGYVPIYFGLVAAAPPIVRNPSIRVGRQP